MHSAAWYWSNISGILETVFFRYLLLVSAVITAAVNPVLLLWVPIKTKEVLPHIITFESCNLALLGIVFSLAMGIKDGAVYRVLQSKSPRIISSAYWRVFFSCLASTVTILVSIVILCIETWPLFWLRVLVQTSGLVPFIYSVLGTSHLMYYFTFLMVEDAQKSKP